MKSSLACLVLACFLVTIACGGSPVGNSGGSPVGNSGGNPVGNSGGNPVGTPPQFGPWVLMDVVVLWNGSPSCPFVLARYWWMNPVGWPPIPLSGTMYLYQWDNPRMIEVGISCPIGARVCFGGQDQETGVSVGVGLYGNQKPSDDFACFHCSQQKLTIPYGGC